MLAVYRMVRDDVYAHASGGLLLRWFSACICSMLPLHGPTVTVLQLRQTTSRFADLTRGCLEVSVAIAK